MNEFTFNGSYYHVTEDLQNFTQAQKTCQRNSSEIADLNALDFEKFVEKIRKVEGFMYNNVLRVQPFNNTIKNCFGVFDLLWINVDEGVSNNVHDVCQGHRRFTNGMYKTLCSKPTESLNSNSLSDSSIDSGNPLVAIVVTLVVFLIIGTFIVLFFNFKKKRRTKLNQKSCVCQIELVESTNEEELNQLHKKEVFICENHHEETKPFV